MRQSPINYKNKSNKKSQRTPSPKPNSGHKQTDNPHQNLEKEKRKREKIKIKKTKTKAQKVLGRAVRSQATKPKSVRNREKKRREKEKTPQSSSSHDHDRDSSPPLTSHHIIIHPHVHSAFGGNSQKAKALQNLYFLPTATPFRDSNESPMNTRPSCGFLSLKVINTLPSPNQLGQSQLDLPAGRPAKHDKTKN